MPIFERACSNGHVSDVIRNYDRRDEPVACPECGADTTRLEVSRSHVPPDGDYSYAPNVGDPERFERQRAAIQSGTKVIERVATKREKDAQERIAEQQYKQRRRY
jgi:hypothetical protein